MSDRDPRDVKRPYRKPEVRVVPLRPEEAVLGSCKTTTVIGPFASGCETDFVSCEVAGS